MLRIEGGRDFSDAAGRSAECLARASKSVLKNSPWAGPTRPSRANETVPVALDGRLKAGHGELNGNLALPAVRFPLRLINTSCNSRMSARTDCSVPREPPSCSHDDG